MLRVEDLELFCCLSMLLKIPKLATYVTGCFVWASIAEGRCFKKQRLYKSFHNTGLSEVALGVETRSDADYAMMRE